SGQGSEALTDDSDAAKTMRRKRHIPYGSSESVGSIRADGTRIRHPFLVVRCSGLSHLQVLRSPSARPKPDLPGAIRWSGSLLIPLSVPLLLTARPGTRAACSSPRLPRIRELMKPPAYLCRLISRR